MEPIFVYITFPSLEECERICGHLLEKSFIACANYSPISSLYRWEGAVQKDNEIRCLCKSDVSKIKAIETFLDEHHSYDVPCLVWWPVHGKKSYMDWAQKEMDLGSTT